EQGTVDARVAELVGDDGEAHTLLLRGSEQVTDKGRLAGTEVARNDESGDRSHAGGPMATDAPEPPRSAAGQERTMDRHDVTELYTSGRYARENPDWHASDAPCKARAVAELVRTLGWRPRHVVDVGCGTGEVLAALQEELEGSGWVRQARWEGW